MYLHGSSLPPSPTPANILPPSFIKFVITIIIIIILNLPGNITLRHYENLLAENILDLGKSLNGFLFFFFQSDFVITNYFENLTFCIWCVVLREQD